MESHRSAHPILLAHLLIPEHWLGQNLPQVLIQRWLTNEERKRIEGMRQTSDRWRMLAGRFLLRHLIRSRYGIDFVNFQFNRHNKPAIAKAGQAPRLDINLAHDGCNIIAAFSSHWDVGVDIANLDQFTDWSVFAQDYLVREEIGWVTACDPIKQVIRAARLWTLKEAILKSTGHGLDIDPREIVLIPDSLEPIIKLPATLPPKSSFRWNEWQADQNALAALVWVQRQPDAARGGVAEVQFEHIAVPQLYQST